MIQKIRKVEQILGVSGGKCVGRLLRNLLLEWFHTHEAPTREHPRLWVNIREVLQNNPSYHPTTSITNLRMLEN